MFGMEDEMTMTRERFETGATYDLFVELCRDIRALLPPCNPDHPGIEELRRELGEVRQERAFGRRERERAFEGCDASQALQIRRAGEQRVEVWWRVQCNESHPGPESELGGQRRTRVTRGHRLHRRTGRWKR